MDFLDPKKNRTHQIRLFVGYVLVGVALFIGTLIVVLQAYGYGVDSKTGNVIQNGLLFVDAHPQAADVILNGTNKGKTDLRMVLPSGSYSVELQREGYRTWKRSFVLEGSSIERLVYPFLFPDKLVSSDAQLYATVPGMATQSPDRHWLVIQQPGNLTSFDVVDLSNEDTTPTETKQLPANLLNPAPGNHSLELAEWSTDNRHVLLKHLFPGGMEYIVFDREAPEQSFNVNQKFPGIAFSEVALRDKKSDQLYLYDGTTATLRQANVGTSQASVILERVLAFKPHGESEILYITDDQAPASKVYLRLQQNADTYSIRDLPKSKLYLLDIARFDGSWMIAAGTAEEGRVYVYKDPQGFLKRTQNRVPTPVYVLKTPNPRYLSFSANTRFIALQDGSEFSVYDVENDKGFRYNTNLAIPADKKATWMDGHRLMTISEDKVRVFDFDGTNQQTLVAAYGTFTPFFDRDYNNLYTISPSATVSGKPALLGTQIRIREKN